MTRKMEIVVVYITLGRPFRALQLFLFSVPHLPSPSLFPGQDDSILIGKSHFSLRDTRN